MMVKNKAQAKWREGHPRAVWAHVALQSALRRGLIQKKSCERCGEPKSEFHHPDYDRPLHGAWLCRSCHRAEHAMLRRKGRRADGE